MAEMTENLLRFRLTTGIGTVTLWRLLRKFGDSDGVFAASDKELAETEGMTRDKVRVIREASQVDPRPEMEKAVRMGVDIIPYDDPAYPKPLLHTFDPPVVLYVKGTLKAEDQVAVGIVGTRHASRYGREQAENLSAALTRAGYTVVSGLALGIDTWAHCGALDAGGRTVGVLGCGFDHMYPEENRDLALEMTRSGAVVSEFCMSVTPSRETFPARNRIIAGMGLGLLVIEAPMRSGALITAKQANDVGRPVFAVPGRVGDAASEGCNQLIRDGAVMVTTVDDILRELNPSLPPPPPPERKRRVKNRDRTESAGHLFDGSEKKPSAKQSAAATVTAGNPEPRENTATLPSQSTAATPAPNPKLTDDQKKILAAVSSDWVTADDIAEASALPAHKATAALAMLKLARLVEQGPGQVYRRRGAET